MPVKPAQKRALTQHLDVRQDAPTPRVRGPQAARPAATPRAAVQPGPAVAAPQAATPQEPQAGWKRLPWVSQLNPQGAAASGYKNGLYKCGPAVAAMVARGLSHYGHLSDAQLITRLGAGLTDATGTSLADMGTMLARAGAKVKESCLYQFSDDFMARNLLAGNKVIARVGLRDEGRGGTMSPHFVLVEGIDPKGHYLISDPLRGKYTVAPQMLATAVNRVGGGLVAVEAPQPQQVRNEDVQALLKRHAQRAPADKESFKSQRLEDIFDTRYHHESEATDEVMAQNQQHIRNDVAQVALVGNTAPSKGGAVRLPEPTKTDSFVDKLVARLNSGNSKEQEKSRDYIGQLASSKLPSAAALLRDIYQEQSREGGGIGQRTKTSDFSQD